jgi:serine/threonine-protein kinase
VIAGKYRLGPMLGEGGMGVVYAATHLVTGKEVALKLLRPGRRVKTDADAARARERALREARASVAVRDPRVLGIDDVLDHDDALVLVMERLHGETLRARLDREKKLAYATARPLLVELAEAVVAAHRAHVVHRDLKPDNVFLLAPATSKGACEVRVLDFGIAKWMADDDPEAPQAPALTTTGAMLGTPMYMSPEQAFGERDVDERADAWAFGVLAFEVLAGERPVSGENLGQVLKAIATGTRPPLAERVTDAPLHVCQAVDRLLVSDRDARGSLAEFLVALRSEGPPGEEATEEPLVRAVSVAPPELGSGRHASSSLDRPKKWLGAAGLGLGVAIVTGGFFVFAARPSSFSPAPASSGVGSVSVGDRVEIPRATPATPRPSEPSVVPSTLVAAGSGSAMAAPVTPSARTSPASAPKLAPTTKTASAPSPNTGPADTRGAGGTVVAPPF